MIRHTAYMLASTALRALAALVTLAILARSWTPTEFGLFTYAFTLSSLIVVVVDYGFGLQVVRDAAREPARVSQIVGDAVQAKLALTIVVFLALALILWIRPSSPAMIDVTALQVAAAITGSFGLVFNLGLRGIGRFDLEAAAVTGGSAVLILVTLIVVFAGGGPIAASAGFLLARVVYLILSIVSFGRVTDRRVLVVGRIIRWFGLAIRGIPFGFHMVLGTVYFQIDTLLIHRLLGLEAVGVYQAAFRLLVGGLLVTDAIANVYLQKVAELSGNRDVVLARSHRLVRRFSSIGLSGAAIFGGAAGILGSVVYGSQYAAADRIIALLGVVLYLRSVGGAYGILLTVSDRQTVRTVVAAVAVILSIGLNLFLIPRWGLQGVVLASIMTHFVVNGAYLLAVRVLFRTAAIDLWTAVQLVGAAALFWACWSTVGTTPAALVTFVIGAIGMLEIRRHSLTSHDKASSV